MINPAGMSVRVPIGSQPRNSADGQAVLLRQSSTPL